MIGKTDFLRINAYAIKELINQKLTLDSKFTDQIYEGSNLAVLIDIFSYIAQNLIYMLNNAASESMFMDTQMYENMNRLCNFIGYNPKGATPSSVSIRLDDTDELERLLEENNEIKLRKYSIIRANTTGGNGNSIFYSVGNEDDKIQNFSKGEYRTRLYNGRWNTYSTVFVATGEPWETFTLANLNSSTELSSYVAHGFIDVYAVVYNFNSNHEPTDIKNIYKYCYTDKQLFKIPVEDEVLKSSKLLYSGNMENNNSANADINDADSSTTTRYIDRVFNLRLNENKEYEIKFGDGNNGALLPRGASIYIVYLDTDGPNGMVEPGEINGNIQENNLGLGNMLVQAIYNGNTGSRLVQDFDITEGYYFSHVTNIDQSTTFIPEESVDDIRENAPKWFRMGNRLVTKGDYEYYVKVHPVLGSEIADVVCMNNWEYVSTFYRWLYNLGSRYFKDPRHYLNQNRLVRNKFPIADPADCNNIYLWYRTRSGSQSDDENTMDSYKGRLKPLKDMTHEPQFIDAIMVKFAICSGPVADIQVIQQNGFDGFEKRSWFEITIDDDAIYASPMIQRRVAGIIRKFFYDRSFKIGGFVNFNNLLSEIMDIDGVVNMRTVYIPLDENGTPNYQAPIIANGLCFASWTGGSLDKLIDEGIDMEVSNTGRTLEQFQYPSFESSLNIESYIKVIKRSMSSIQRVQY